jgi:hypothetical protein
VSKTIIQFEFLIEETDEYGPDVTPGDRYNEVIQLIGEHRRVKVTLFGGAKHDGYLVPDLSDDSSLCLQVWEGGLDAENPVRPNRLWIFTSQVKSLVVVA